LDSQDQDQSTLDGLLVEVVLDLVMNHQHQVMQVKVAVVVEDHTQLLMQVLEKEHNIMLMDLSRVELIKGNHIVNRPKQTLDLVEVEEDSLEDNILQITSDTQVVVVDLVLWLFVINMME
jgi:hypothetical protein